MNAKMRCHALNIICTVNLVSASALAVSERAEINLNLAGQYFQEARAVCTRDAGRLWGVSLCGPMLFVDPVSRTIVANQADQDGLLRKKDGLFVGRLPADQLIANTPTRWAGTHWAMIVWPLPQDQRARGRLMAHELWHLVQHQLLPGVQTNLGMPNTSNSHLDTREGRIFLQLEWRALEAALRREEPDRRTALEDALVFRAYRRSLFPSAAAQERSLELNEGLAEYTGVRLSTKSDREAIDDAVTVLRQGTRRETFVRSFAYASGPAYGLLLDHAAPDWREAQTLAADLGDLLRAALSIDLPTALKDEAGQRAKRYNGKQLMADEAKRDTTRQERLARYRAHFVDGPVLIIPLTHPSVQFNPGNLHPLGDLGTVYPTMTLSDAWGILTVEKGALMNTNWSEVRVTAPKDTTARPVKGDGWILELNIDWMLQPGIRTGSYMLARLSGG